MSWGSHNSTDNRLRSFIDRVLRLKEEQDARSDDIREVYAEAKGEGYDKTAMGQVVAYLRKRGKDAAKLDEQSAIFELYLSAYDAPVVVAIAHTPAGARAREIIEQFPQSKGEINGPEVEPAASSFDEIAETDSNSQPTSSPDANKTGAEPPPSAPVAPIEDDFEPPAFLARKKPMRPHCLNPECCAGQGYEHCHRCKKAMAESEAA